MNLKEHQFEKSMDPTTMLYQKKMFQLDTRRFSQRPQICSCPPYDLFTDTPSELKLPQLTKETRAISKLHTKLAYTSTHIPPLRTQKINLHNLHISHPPSAQDFGNCEEIWGACTWKTYRPRYTESDALVSVIRIHLASRDEKTSRAEQDLSWVLQSTQDMLYAESGHGWVRESP